MYLHPVLMCLGNVFWNLCHFIDILFDINLLRLLQAAHNRSSVQNEIKKSICSLILEINKKGKMLMSHLEVWQIFQTHYKLEQ